MMPVSKLCPKTFAGKQTFEASLTGYVCSCILLHLFCFFPYISENVSLFELICSIISLESKDILFKVFGFAILPSKFSDKRQTKEVMWLLSS